jgi:transcriptional regulator with XRE-family HTH domain
MVSESGRAARLARTLRGLRESHWPGVSLTQAQLSEALGVASATISSWESATSVKAPNVARLEAYARFFSTRRSLDGEAHLVPEAELDPEEQQQFLALKDQLLDLRQDDAEDSEHERDIESHSARRSTFTFDEGPINVICPEAPQDSQSPFAREDDPNFAKLQQYADLDALIEIYGHLRATNPTLDVYHRLATDAVADDLSTHVILLGGIAWNKVTRRFQEETARLPIQQVIDPQLETGEIFSVADKLHYPVWEDDPDEKGKKILSHDVAFLARLPNPFNHRRTLTICNGIHSRGVLGAVRCLTDSRVREANERYLAERFPDGRFALLLRVPVVTNETMSPDLKNPGVRLYEWPSTDGTNT